MSKANEPPAAAPGTFEDLTAAGQAEQTGTVPAAEGSIPEPAAPEHHCEPSLLSLLVCPYTRTSLGYASAGQELISRPERLAFPIRDGIPILVREEARSLDDGA